LETTATTSSENNIERIIKLEEETRNSIPRELCLGNLENGSRRGIAVPEIAFNIHTKCIRRPTII